MGLVVCPAGLTCMHRQAKDETQVCCESLDVYGDHAVTCNVGPHLSYRHAAINDILKQAGKDAGYAALLEQVVPELGLRRRLRSGVEVLEEARLDVELFGHPYAADRLLDGTVRHPAAEHVLAKAAREVGAAARCGVATKEKRYPTRAGKAVTACAMETWGYIDDGLDALLAELAVLAAQRQKDRGVQPTRWRLRWRTLLSISVAMSCGKAILASLPSHAKPCCVLQLRPLRVNP